MYISADEEFLYECYLMLEKKNKNKNKKKEADISKDREIAKGLSNSIRKKISLLKNVEVIDSVILQKHLVSAKGMFIQYSIIKGRNPSCISIEFEKNADLLIRLVCKHEAELIQKVRWQVIGGRSIDLKSIFTITKNHNLLGNILAHTLVIDAITDSENPIGFNPIFYSTKSGKRYHDKNCFYCKGRQLMQLDRETVKEKNLIPCKCLQINSMEVDGSSVTVFIDESIHPVQWNHEGKSGMSGSFSYIICRGKLSNECEISKLNIIVQGVKYIDESKHIERIAEEAIGELLLYLLYDQDFIGRVYIYTDNKSAAEHWKEKRKNMRIAKEFADVEVMHISREQNTYADKLGRTRMLLDIPIEVYNETVKSCNQAKILSKELVRKDDEIKKLQRHINKLSSQQEILNKGEVYLFVIKYIRPWKNYFVRRKKINLFTID